MGASDCDEVVGVVKVAGPEGVYFCGMVELEVHGGGRQL